MTIYRLIYASSALDLMSEEELLDILAVSRKNNIERQITGILLYKDGNFIQVLEGPRENVLKTYDAIVHDDRHRSIMTLGTEETETRLFPEWTMGFRDMAQLSEKDIAGYKDYMDDPFTPEYFSNNPGRVRILLNTFIDAN